MTALLAALVVSTPRHITFIRHSETVANATGKYNSRTLNTFSSKGEELVKKLTERLLKEPRPGVIFVSPSPRALRTISPYLRQTRQRATIWPTLYECCTERPKMAATRSFAYGAKIVLPSDIKDLFVVLPGLDRLPAPRNYGEGLAQVQKTVSLIQNGFRGGRMMLVGHSVHGGKLLKALTGKSYHVKNAEPIEIDLAPR